MYIKKRSIKYLKAGRHNMVHFLPSIYIYIYIYFINKQKIVLQKGAKIATHRITV